MKAIKIAAVVVAIGVAGCDLIEPPTHQGTKLLLSMDSCGCKVFRLETDGRVFLVNTQGGICEVK